MILLFVPWGQLDCRFSYLYHDIYPDQRCGYQRRSFDVTEFGGINLGQLWDTKYLGSPLFFLFWILLGIKQFLTNMVVVMG